MKWCALAFVFGCAFWVLKTPNRRKIMRCLWLNTIDEQLWFASQYSVYYISEICCAICIEKTVANIPNAVDGILWFERTYRTF